MAKLSTVNAIPKMTSNTTPSGIAISSGANSTSYDNWMAFDGSVVNSWASTTNNIGWIGYDFTRSISIYKYTLKPKDNVQAQMPKDWTFEGWNGSSWVVLDTQTNITGWLATGDKKEFTINRPSYYSKYRINITGSNNNSALVIVGELEMYEVIFEKKAVIKNPSTQKVYSLDNKTLIHLPSSSDENMILHGIENGKEIKLDEDFNKMNYVQDTSEVLDVGKKFTHVVDMDNTKINKIIL